MDVIHVTSIGKSRFALPLRIYEDFRIMGEVAMSSNQCMAIMKDGEELPLSSSGVSAFFDFPEPYTEDDVVSVRRIRHDSTNSVLSRFSFDLFVTWEEDER